MRRFESDPRLALLLLGAFVVAGSTPTATTPQQQLNATSRDDLKDLLSRDAVFHGLDSRRLDSVDYERQLLLNLKAAPNYRPR